VRTVVSQVAGNHRAEHAEGPCWDPRLNKLLWVDQYAGLVHQADFNADTRCLEVEHSFQVGAPVGAVVPSIGPDGGWLLAADHGFAHLAHDGTVTRLGQPEADAVARMRMNDGKADPRGAMWAGSMAFDKKPGAGSLYRLDPDGTITVARARTTISNGLAFSPDGDRLYYIDTPTQRVDRFHIAADGRLTDQATIITVDPSLGHPDGMCIDAEGCLWVALWGGSAVHRYTPAGGLLAIVEVDAPQVSSCTFGGPDLSTLFITTSAEDMTGAQRARQEHSGKLFRADVGVKGRPADTYSPNP
jgi:sugar lactone lactonase YvrE